MHDPSKALVILSPAFAEAEGDSWLPAQESFVRTVNALFPLLKIIIITFHFPAVKEQYNWYGNEVIALGGGMKGRWNSLLLWRRAWNTLKRLHKERNLLGIFSFFCSECAFVGHHFAKKNTLQHYIWILGQDARAGNRQVGRIKPAADELIAISDFLVREFERNHGIRPAHMIPLGLQRDEFQEGTAERYIDLLGVGSLIPLKQYDVFIDVAKAVQEQLPAIRARICGDGEEQLHLQQEIDRLQLNDHITLTGKLDRTKVLSLMHSSKILLHTSSYEGFGMVCAEALYAGAHVISFCKPLDKDFFQWHIVEDKQQMIDKALELLCDTKTTYDPVLTYAMEDTARSILERFGYTAPSTS